MTNASEIATGYFNKRDQWGRTGVPSVEEITMLITQVQAEAREDLQAELVQLKKLIPRKTPAATAQRDSARKNRLEVITERYQLLALLAAYFPAHISPTKHKLSATDEWKWVVCLHTPEGNLSWRISDDVRRTIFRALPDASDDADPDQTKDSKKTALAALVAKLKVKPVPERSRPRR